MTHAKHQLSGLAETQSIESLAFSRATWQQDGPYIVDDIGRPIALMQGARAEHEWNQQRILAAVNAMQGTPTHFIEELLEQSEDNVIMTLITRDRQMAATLDLMQQKIAAHCREIEQLREMMEACRVFEEQRILLNQAAGAAEYEGLLRTLGMR